MKITFLGAAGEVTGSQHLIETDNLRLLLDCGLFQGQRKESRAKNQEFHCRPKELDGVILSHAHIDHCGNLPGLYRAGFEGTIFCTDATADIADVMLQDAAHIQEEDAKYLNKKRKGRDLIEPLYTSEDAEDVVRQFQPLHFGEWHELASDVKVRFSPAGHILGSAITELEVRERSQWKRVVFTGDLGRYGMPLLVDPAPVEMADALIIESTYGNRVHPPVADMKDDLLRIITSAYQKGGRVIIPAFSLGRTQQVVYHLNELFNENKLPRIPIYVDSPLSNRCTAIHRRYQEHLDDDVNKTLRHDIDVFGFETLRYTESPQQSMELNDRSGPFVVISASGMCESGRILHHLKHAISHERNTVVLIGYQAPGTLGWRIAERQPYVRIHDTEFAVKAKIEQLGGLSAHADVNDFKKWLDQSTETGDFDKAFIVHGEKDGAEGMASLLKTYCEGAVTIPQRFQSFTI